MCIIVYKPAGVATPSKKILKTCFENNRDGAGFMFCYNDAVVIKKGFMNFESFWRALKKARTIAGDDAPYIYHFRISTQAGTRADCCHPFPVSPVMDDLRALDCTASVAVAHNGIIDLTSIYSRAVDYSDTMLFITDYVSLIIDGAGWYEDPRRVELIKRLADSKLAILDNNGHCELIGDFVKDNGVYYSNTSYKPALTVKKPATVSRASCHYYDDFGIDMRDGLLYGMPINAYNCALEYTGDYEGCAYCEDCGRCHDYIALYGLDYAGAGAGV